VLQLILLSLIPFTLIDIIVSLFPEDLFINPNTLHFEMKIGFSLSLIIVGIINPIIETVIYQWGIIHLVCKLIKSNNINYYFSILISAIVFGLMHSHSHIYMIYAFLTGLILGFLTYALMNKRHGFWIIATIHCIHNLYALILNQIL